MKMKKTMATKDCHQFSTIRDQGMTHRNNQEARRATVIVKSADLAA